MVLSDCRKSEMFAVRQSLPCVKGGGTAQAVTEGLIQRKVVLFYIIPVKSQLLPHNPPVKNQRFLPAPFTQGGLCAIPHQYKIEFFDTLRSTIRLDGASCLVYSGRLGIRVSVLLLVPSGCFRECPWLRSRRRQTQPGRERLQYEPALPQSKPG